MVQFVLLVMHTSHTVTCVATEMLKIVTNHRVQPLNRQTLLAADMPHMRTLFAKTFITQILPANIESELERFLKQVCAQRKAYDYSAERILNTNETPTYTLTSFQSGNYHAR